MMNMLWLSKKMILMVAIALVLVSCAAPQVSSPAAPVEGIVPDVEGTIPVAPVEVPVPQVVEPAPALPVVPAPVMDFTIKTSFKAGLGDYLVDSKGMSLYYFTKDVIDKSNATGNVLQAWPVFYSESLSVSAGLITGDFGFITREDGLKQTTFKGWPLYYYFKDMAAGDTLGEGVNAAWYVMTVPFYTVMIQTKADLGNYLVDSKGMTLYYFTKDSLGKSTATMEVLQNWPAFDLESFVVPSALKSLDFYSTTTPGGIKIATYKGMPLYYYVKDMVSGDTNGHGVGGVWFVIDPEKFLPQIAESSQPSMLDDPSIDYFDSSEGIS